MPTHRRIIPSLADLPHDIEGVVPLDLLQTWNASAKDANTHGSLLAPYEKEGTLVCSDSSGLSKLSRAEPLLEVMRLVHHPKSIVHAHGSAIGGIPIGTWAADNTSMFYPASIPVPQIVAQMHAAQEEIARESRLQIGLALHYGTFFLLADGAFGADASAIEYLAEEHTKAQEILVSEAVKSRCDSTFCKLASCPELPQELIPHKLLSCTLPRTPKTPRPYPFPFTSEFAEFLDRRSADTQAQEEMWKRYGRKKHVVFLVVRHAASPFLLDMLTNWLAASLAIDEDHTEVEIIKNNGQITIALADNAKDAVAFAARAVQTLMAQGFTACAGIALGEVLVFPLQDGKEIAGSPVNLASKLSEDTGEPGAVAIEEEAAEGLDQAGWSRFELSVSGVPLRGIKKMV